MESSVLPAGLLGVVRWVRPDKKVGMIGQRRASLRAPTTRPAHEAMIIIIIAVTHFPCNLLATYIGLGPFELHPPRVTDSRERGNSPLCSYGDSTFFTILLDLCLFEMFGFVMTFG